MAHIMVVSAGLTGLFNANLALIQQLKQAGHGITYGSPRDLSRQIQALDIPFVQLPPWTVPVDRESGSWWGRLRRFKTRQHLAVGDFHMEEFSQILREVAPDLLLIDIEMHPHIMTAVISRFQVALLCPFLSIWRQAKLPPLHTSIVPGEGWRGTWWGIQYSWLRYGWQKWRAHQRDRQRKLGCDYLSVLACYARQIGYPVHTGLVTRLFAKSWLVPYPHRTLPVLCLHAQALEFPHSPPKFVHYVGPMVNEQRLKASAPLVDSLPRLETFLQNRSGEFLIYCGCSSFTPASQDFLKTVLAIASTHTHWDFVIGLGGKSSSGASKNEPPDNKPFESWLEFPPKNTVVMQWAPQLQLLSQADCAIINGGAHSIAECIHFGVPMLVYPLTRDDQNGNAARVAYHGLGLVAQPPQNDAAQFSDSLQKLLTQARYKKNLARMQATFQTYARNQTARRTVEALLAAENVKAGTPTEAPAQPDLNAGVTVQGGQAK